jgi:SAM-dependent methyltransferase
LPTCPICGNNQFVTANKRASAACAGCGSLERTRLMWLVIERLGIVGEGKTILHLAPEPAVARKLHAIAGRRYKPRDFVPENYRLPFAVKKFDLCSDVFDLDTESFDIIIHNHVLEHIPCNPAVAFLELNRALKRGGYHIFSVPLYTRNHREDLSPKLTSETRAQHYGQGDHMRAFGIEDFPILLRSIFSEFQQVKLADILQAAELTNAAIPREAIDALTGHTVFCFQKPRAKRHSRQRAGARRKRQDA